MSFNRRGPDRRHDRPEREHHDRPSRPPGGDWPPRDARGGSRPPYPDRGGSRPPYADRDRPGGDRPPYQQRGDRPSYPPRGDRPFTPRPRFDRPPDEGGMSIRLDPRRLNALKHLAGEAGVRPGDLVRQWVEERIDASRTGAGGRSLAESVELLAERVAALEAATGISPAETAEPRVVEPEPVTAEAPDVAEAEPVAAEAGEPEPEPESTTAETESIEAPTPRTRRNAVAASPSTRVALHDEIIAVIRERGPSTAAELAAAITERGRYAPPRSGKALDAAMVSQRVSNPTYRSRFVRRDGRIDLAEEAR